MDHGPDTGLLHAGEGGVQADGRQGADHQELAGGLSTTHHLSRNGENARHDGHGQEAQDKPGEDLLDGEEIIKLMEKVPELLTMIGFLKSFFITEKTGPER